jgi:hypothetical protein
MDNGYGAEGRKRERLVAVRFGVDCHGQQWLYLEEGQG